jgi:CelD/BcsL family acetyltransferase involved in cellulose biosynthesis
VPVSTSRPDEWEPGIEVLRFFVGGRELGSVKLNALVLTTPFTRLSTNLEESAPSPEALPEGVDAFVIPAQPIGAVLPSRLMLMPQLIRYVGPATERYSIDLRGTFAGYLRKFSAKSRYTLARKVRRFEEFSGGHAGWSDLKTCEEMRAFYRSADQIARNSWAAELGKASFADRLPEAALLALARRGVARGFVLFHGEGPIAYVFCRAHGEHLLYEYLAYDQRYSKWSPGDVLLYMIIEKLIAERRFQRLDLGEGTLGYKSFFGTDSTRCARVIYFRRSLGNVALVSAHYGVCSASVAAGKFLRALGMKQRLKRLMMGKSRRPGQGS